MKLTNKGFAITSIIYSMLVLFLALLLLIMGNLANRKVLFDKEKSDILSKINPTSAPFCILEGDKDGSGTISIGDQYVCNPGDGNKTFYVLEAGDNISLIMSENIDSETFDEGSEVDAALLEKTSGWTNSKISSIALPTTEQLTGGGDNHEVLYPWLEGFYWTSTVEMGDRWRVEGSQLDYLANDGIRPVITVSKSDI